MSLQAQTATSSIASITGAGRHSNGRYTTIRVPKAHHRSALFLGMPVTSVTDLYLTAGRGRYRTRSASSLTLK